MAAKRRPGRVPAEVRDYFRAKALRPSFSYRDVWREEHRAAFAVAKAVEVDLIADIRDAVKAAIDAGTPFEDFRRQLTPILQARGWWGVADQTDPETGERRPAQLGSPRRLRLIYDTNVRMARNAGQWQRIQRTKRLAPYLVYHLGAAERHRPSHAQQDGKVVHADDAYWNFWMPLNGYGCHCWVEQVTRERANELGGPESPDLNLQTHTDPRTGKKTQHPAGVDPTFAYNPGEDRFEGLRRAGIVK